MSKSASPKRSTKDRYASFIASLDPVTIALIHSAARIDRLDYLESAKEQIFVSVKTILINREDDHFDVRSSISVRIEAEGRKKPLARFSATFDVHFHASEIKEEFIDQFVKSDVRLLLWPYFREYVSNLSGRMHVPPVIMPIAKPQEGGVDAEASRHFH